MSTTSQVLAVVFGIALVFVWIMESFLYRWKVFHPLLMIEPDDFEAVRVWNVNLGFYNLTTGIALFLGVWLLQDGQTAAGEALVLFTAAQHFVLAFVLLASAPRMWVNTVLQATIPAAILLLQLV